jgi:hypothetical protein
LQHEFEYKGIASFRRPDLGGGGVAVAAVRVLFSALSFVAAV